MNVQQNGLPHFRNVLWLGLLIASVISAVWVFNVTTHQIALAQSSGSITGYAWSDTIGWISMNGSTYGLTVSASGTVTGYAWSDNIGWVSTNSADLTGCPSAPCTASIDSGGVLRGWMRAVAGNTAQSGSWDGFISLSGTGYGPTRQTSGSFSGYAWGDINVGWLSFNYASTDYMAEPTAELKVRKVGDTTWLDSITINPTDEVELGWNQSGTTNTVSCSAVPPTNNFSTGNATSGIDSDIDEPIGATNNVYGLLCYGIGGSQKSDSVTVTTQGGIGAEFVTCPGATDLPSRVFRNANVEMCWQLGTNDPAVCTLKAGDVSILSPVNAATSHTYNNVIGEVNFTLECTGGDSDTLKVQALIEPQET